jgi:hypothetical protein
MLVAKLAVVRTDGSLRTFVPSLVVRSEDAV